MEVKTTKGIKIGKVINEFIQVGGPDHNKKFVAVVLAGSGLSLFNREAVYHISEIKILD